MNVFQRFHPKREQVNALQKNHDSNFDWCRDKNVSAFVWHEVERERERGENAWTFCGWRLGSTGLCSWRTRRSFYLREGVRGGNIPPCAWCWLYFFFREVSLSLFSFFNRLLRSTCGHKNTKRSKQSKPVQVRHFGSTPTIFAFQSFICSCAPCSLSNAAFNSFSPVFFLINRQQEMAEPSFWCRFSSLRSCSCVKMSRIKNSLTAFVGETDCRAAGRLLPNSYI